MPGVRPHTKSKSGRRHLSKGRRQYKPSKIGAHQAGGSPASNNVMADTNAAPAMVNHVVSPRVPGADNSLGSLAPSCQQGGFASGVAMHPMPSATHAMPSVNTASKVMKGGSDASDLVMSQLASDAKTEVRGNSEWPAIKADMNSLNLYQTTGGSRRKSKKSKKSKSHKSRKSHHRRNKNKSKHHRGGGSDWIMSQYSQGPINNPEASTSGFSQSMAASRAELMNPPNLGSAGSGAPMTAVEGGNVRHVGAPLL